MVAIPKRPLKVLLIEDNPADADLTKVALRESEVLIDLVVKESGEDGLMYLRREGNYRDVSRPDLVLLDLGLPGINGRTVLKEMKTDSQLKTIPVVILSSETNDLLVQDSYVKGANCFVTKPVRLDQFSEIVRSISDFWFSVVRSPPEKVRQMKRDEARKRIRIDKRLPRVKVLVIEDNPGDRDLVLNAMRDAEHAFFDADCVSTLEDGVKRLSNGPYDLVLLDLGLPDSKTEETFARVQAAAPNVPVVILTVYNDVNFAISSVREGAQDYVVKGNIDPETLTRIVTYSMERKRIEIERELILERESLAREEAEQAIFERDEFLSIASHELKNPIAALALRNEILLRNWAKLSEDKKIAHIEKNAKDTRKIASFVERLLDISRINVKKLKLHPTDIVLSDTIREVVDRIVNLSVPLAPAISFDLEPNLVGHWDHVRIEQVITNLVTNAIRYGGGSPISIGTRKRGDKALLWVKDQGPGIPKEKISMVFEKYQQGDSTKASSEGLGLGLYIVKRIVEEHGGQIEVQSDRGRGATFLVEIPFEVENEVARQELGGNLSG